MKKKAKKAVSHKRTSGTKLMFLSVILLLIVFEALYILRDHHLNSNALPQVAGVSSSR